MPADRSGPSERGPSPISRALLEAIEAADAVPRSVEKLGEASATASEAMQRLAAGFDRVLEVGRRFLAGAPPPPPRRKRRPPRDPSPAPPSR